MPEENQDDQIEEEMLRMMQEEDGGGDAAGDTGETEGDAEADMLAAMQAEMAGEDVPSADGESGGDDSALEDQMLQAMMSETGAEEGQSQAVMQQGMGLLPGGTDSSVGGVGRLLDVKLSVSIELGRTKEPISTVLEWTEGSLIELSKVSGEAVDVLINGKAFAKGEVVTIAETFGVRITELHAVVRQIGEFGH
jgi:flagellar motor switch protein FliN/FliY